MRVHVQKPRPGPGGRPQWRTDDRRILERRTRVSRLYLMNYTTRQIAAEVGVHHSTVESDIRELREAWKCENFQNINAFLMRELMKLDQMESTLQRDFMLAGQATKNEETGERTVFLGQRTQVAQAILKLMERRAKLCGLDRPERASTALTEIILNEGEDDGIHMLDQLIAQQLDGGRALESLPEPDADPAGDGLEPAPGAGEGSASV